MASSKHQAQRVHPYEVPFAQKDGVGFIAFSGKVDAGFPPENATTQKS
jgi:hypothetical protein